MGSQKSCELAKMLYKLKNREKPAFFSPSEVWCLPAPSSIKPMESELVIDSGAPMHMLSKKDLNAAESETVRTSSNPTTVITASSEVQRNEEATVHVRDLDLFVTVQLLEDTPPVPSRGQLCEDHGYSYDRTAGLSNRSSSCSTAPTPTTSARENSERSVEAKEPGTWARGNSLRGLREWLDKFTENLVEEPDIPEPRPEVKSATHNVFTHFRKDPNCEVCRRTNITKAPCRKRIGNSIPCAEKFGDLTTADHKVLNEDGESRNSHRYAVIVQDLATQWTQAYPCNTKTSQEKEKS